mmetsp:Transcript_22377/g.33825  ORF Transcript_22377/g.33825 Transcript_22377/m.33825 type:complete len:81 (-) Transcript_22377:1381-1623(-)
MCLDAIFCHLDIFLIFKEGEDDTITITSFIISFPQRAEFNKRSGQLEAGGTPRLTCEYIPDAQDDASDENQNGQQDAKGV